MVNMLNSKIMRENQSHHLKFIQVLKVFQCQKIKQNPEESYTNKYQKGIASSFGHKLVCV